MSSAALSGSLVSEATIVFGEVKTVDGAHTIPGDVLGFRLRRIGGRPVIPVVRIVMHCHANPTDPDGICLASNA
jgi:hypothetical protein